MKISDLKFRKKQLVFNNGESKLEDGNQINGEVNFYEINTSKLLDINEKVVSDMPDDISNEELSYLLIPELCDIVMDVTREEFLEMLKNPSSYMIAFMDAIITEIKNVFDMANSLVHMGEEADKVAKVQPQQPTKEEKLENLYKSLQNTEDKEQRKKIVKEISKLELED